MGAWVKQRISLFIVAFLVCGAVAAPGWCVFQYTPHAYNPFGNQSGSTTVQWPSSSISASQLQGLFSQNPSLSNINIQFPNNKTLSVTPDALQGLVSNFQQQAQSMGVSGQVSNMVFSSLSNAAGIKGNALQVGIDSLANGNIGDQVTSLLGQLRSGNMANMGGGWMDWIPDWLKGILQTIYQAVYSFFDWVEQQALAIAR